MGVDFGDAFGQMRDQPLKSRMRHGAAPGEPENLIRRGDVRALKQRPLNARQWGQGGGG